MTRSRLPDVETLACSVAGEYAARWARSVARLQARAGDAADAPGPWLVDGFAGADLQRAAMRGASVQAPAAAFVRAARESFGEGARVVLVEEDPGLLARLEEGVRATGIEPRRAAHPAEAEPGEVVLIEASFAAVASRLAAEVADAPALVRLAPLTARVLPWTTQELLADLSGADLLLRFPQEDFARAGKFGGPLADFPPHLRRVVEGCSAFFADERHGWLLAWREAARAGGDEAALAGAVERLRGMLGGNGGGERIARAARLEGAGGAAVHVLLSTPHLEHALELNGAAADGGAPPPVPVKTPKGKAGKAAASASAPPAAAAPAESAPPEVARPADAPPSIASSEATESVDAAEVASARAEPTSESADAGDGVGAPVASASDSPAAPAPAAAQPASSGQRPPPARPASPAPAPTPPAEPGPEAAPALLDLFALEPVPVAPEPARGPDLRAIADDLHERHAEQRVPFRELLIELADAGLAPEQVRTALGILKRDRRAAYRSLDAEGAEVEFLVAPVAPAAPPAPKPRKARKPVPGVLGFFDEPEPEDDAPSSSSDAPSSSLDAPLTLADAIGFEDAGLEEAASAPDPAPAKKSRRRKAE